MSSADSVVSVSDGLSVTLGPLLLRVFVDDLLLEENDALHQGLGAGWAAGHVDVDGDDLILDIGLANVQNVQQFLEATDGLAIYTGRKGSPDPDFALVAGEAYFVKMSTTVSYTPSHF